MRTEDAKAYGPFDTKAFPSSAYADVDLCGRLRRFGRSLAHAPIKGLVRHDRKQSAAEDKDGRGADARATDYLNFRIRWSAPTKPRRVLVRDLGCIGDNVCATPSVQALRRKHPALPLWIITESPAVWMGNPDVDGISDSYDEWSPDDLVYSMRQHADHRNTDHLVTVLLTQVDKPAVDGWERLPPLAVENAEPRVYETGGAREWAQGKTRHLGRFVVLCTDATWWIRRWPHAAAFARLVRRRFGCEVVHLAVKREGQRLGPYDWRGETSFPQAMALVERATMLVSVDTGLMHAAGALGVPSVGLFGPTQAALRLHAGQKDVTADLACTGCFGTARGAYRFCARAKVLSLPQGPYAECMRRISPGHVVRRMEELWPNC